MDALNRYSPEYGSQFKTFAYKRIYGEIVDAIRQHGYLSRSQLDLVKRIEKTEQRLIGELKREPSLKEICEELDISEEDYYSIIQNTHMNYSFSLQSGDDDESKSSRALNTIPDMNQKTPDEKLENESLKKELKQIIVGLPERERLILALYYYEELTLADIGQVLGVSESRISQIINATLLQIRAKLRRGGSYGL